MPQYLEGGKRVRPLGLQRQPVARHVQRGELDAVAQVLILQHVHLVALQGQRAQPRQCLTQALFQLGEAIEAHVQVEEPSIPGQCIGGQAGQSVVGHVQARDVPGKILGDLTQAQVAAVGRVPPHNAGGLLLVRGRPAVVGGGEVTEEGEPAEEMAGPVWERHCGGGGSSELLWERVETHDF